MVQSQHFFRENLLIVNALKPVKIILNSLIMVVCSLFSVSGHAQSQSGLFWAVISKGSSDTSYLLGTIHKYPKEVIQLSGEAILALKKSKQLYLEIQIDWKMAVSMLTSSSLENETGLESIEHFTEEDWAKVKRWFIENHKLESTEFDRLSQNPKYSGLGNFFIKAYGFEANAIEDNLKDLARSSGIKIKGLDKNWNDIQSWYAWYNQLAAYQKEKVDIEETINNQYYEFADLITAYAIQDTGRLATTGAGDNWENGLSLAAWRNTQWMKQLPKIIREKSFIAVGAAHLFGGNGLLNLLQQSGYALIPIASDFTGPKLERFINRNSRDYKIVE